VEVRKTGYLVLAICWLGGLAMVAVPLLSSGESPGTPVFLGTLLLLVGCGLLLSTLRHKRRAAHDDWLFQNGIPGTATIVDDDLVGTSGDLVWVTLELELEVPPYERRLVTKKRVYMPYYVSLWMLPGHTMQVYANPKDPEDFILVF
jgi:hypothetical protein